MNENSKLLYSVNEVSVIVGVSERHVRRLSLKYGIGIQLLGSARKSRRQLWTLSDIESLVLHLRDDESGRPGARKIKTK